jgi:hypothetical protein
VDPDTTGAGQAPLGHLALLVSFVQWDGDGDVTTAELQVQRLGIRHFSFT